MPPSERSTGRARLFVAVAPPPAVVAELERAVRPLRSVEPRLRWSSPERWHVTLAFLGPVADEVRPALSERLARVARRHPPAELALAGGGRFGTRVLWIGISGDLGRLATGVRRAATRAGLTAGDDRPLRAHLTLARVPEGHHADLRPLAETLRRSVPPRSWMMSEISLMSSHGGPSPVYRTGQAWVLRGRAPGGSGPGDEPSAE